MSARSFRLGPTDNATFYPRLLGRSGAVATHHYLSAEAAAEVLKAGGNAVDGTVAAVLVEGLVNPQMHGIGGECPLIVRMAGDTGVHVVNGNTAAPARATPEAFRERGLREMPEEGILAAGVPAALAALLAALSRFGRLPFAAVAAPALQLARDGFPVHRGLLRQERFGLNDLAPKFAHAWPASAALYLPGGALPPEGTRFRNAALADLLDHLIGAEAKASGAREDRLEAVRACFYAGEPAERIASFSAQRDGLLARGDLERYRARFEAPSSLAFGDATLFKCGFWNQGPALLQTLAILAETSIAACPHNSADYLHLLLEAMKLAYADREQWYGDPEFVAVPGDALLSADYARRRAALIDRAAASADLLPGDPLDAQRTVLPADERFATAGWGPGTVHVSVVDADGSMVAATPSGGWLKSSEAISDLGFPLGNRLMTFYLGPAHHPNVVAPGKRPRTTISPSLCLSRGEPWMVFGSMGGDQQDQWQLQFFLNRALFGHTIQEAIEAPKVSSEHFPGFFAPHDHFPRRVRAEPSVGAATLQELARRGHEISLGPDWSEGHLVAAGIDLASGALEAGCDPRGAKSEIFAPAARCW